jgi:hypothetical protein
MRKSPPSGVPERSTKGTLDVTFQPTQPSSNPTARAKDHRRMGESHVPAHADVPALGISAHGFIFAHGFGCWDEEGRGMDDGISGARNLGRNRYNRTDP